MPIQTQLADLLTVTKEPGRIDRIARVSMAIMALLILVALVSFGVVSPSVFQLNQQPICGNATILKEIPTIWPSSETIRKCIAQHAVFVQLEYFCRVIQGSPEMEVHSYSDYVNKKITITINVRK